MKTKRQIQHVESLEPRQMLHGGPELVYDFNTEPRDYASFDSTSNHAWLNGQMLFAASDENGDVELWRTDGTTEGTVRVKDINPGNASSQPRGFKTGDSQVFFLANKNEMWVTNGTEAGTLLLKTLPHGTYEDFGGLVVDDRLYFQVEGQLWKSDGTLPSTSIVEVMEPEYRRLGAFHSQNGTVYFTAYGETSRDIWETDGSEQGTFRIVEDCSCFRFEVAGSQIGYVNESSAFPGLTIYDTISGETTSVDELGPTLNEGWDRADFLSVGDRLLVRTFFYFGIENHLWAVDSSGELSIINGSISEYEATDETLYFKADDEWFRTDGTVEGTQSVDSTEVFEDLASAETVEPFFWAHDGLWKRPTASTRAALVHDGIRGRSVAGINDHFAIRKPFEIVSLPGSLLLAIDGRPEVWRIDDADGKVQSIDAMLDTQTYPNPRQHYFHLRPWGQGAIVRGADQFSWTDGTHLQRLELNGQLGKFWNVFGDELIFDTYSAGTSWQLHRATGVADDLHQEILLEGDYDDHDVDVQVVNDQTFVLLSKYDSNNETTSAELWVANDRESRLLMNESWEGSDVELVAATNQLYLRLGSRLWSTDGTENETRLLTDDVGWTNSFYFGNWYELLGDNLFFQVGSDPWQGNELWMTNGTTDGTMQIIDDDDRQIELITSTEDHMFYLHQTSEGDPGNDCCGADLWMTDGTSDGSILVASGFRHRGGNVPLPPIGTAVGDTLFFVADDANYDRDLWRTDGTAAGTIRYDINPTWESNPKYMTEHNGYVYFRADDGFHGAELWRVPVELPEPALIPGDTNADGNVDFADFLALSANFGRDDADGFSDGDFNDDDVVDFADFLILSENFGTRRTSAGTSTSNGGVA